MKDKSILRLFVFRIVVFSLVATLLGRAFYLQIAIGDTYVAAANKNAFREVFSDPVRGLILDQAGRPLVANRSTMIVSVDTRIIEELPDKGESVIRELAKVLERPYSQINDRLIPCGQPGAKNPPICWDGSLFQPVPVAQDVSDDIALKIMERTLDFPGVSAELAAIRTLPQPFGVNLAHILGYVGPVTDVEIKNQKDLGLAEGEIAFQNNDRVGRAGIERFYDKYLRGIPGIKLLAVDQAAKIKGVISETDPTPGQYVVLNIDAKLQTLVEQQLEAAVLRARANELKGDSGAAVVIDVTNGQILAIASYPTYDPKVWLDGISTAEYEALSDKANNVPLISRATQGLFAPGSVFKVVSAAAAADAGFSFRKTYSCPAQLEVGNRVFRNYNNVGYGNISMQRAIEVSCNTVFYDIANTIWLRDGGLRPVEEPKDNIEKMTKAFGFGTKTGIDLPEDVNGRVGGRAFKQAFWEQNHEAWCKRAESGYPEVAETDPDRANLLQEFAKENCTEGMRFRAGDAINLSIGQGDTVVSPLQMAVAYAAIANGGTIYEPRVAKAIMNSDGSIAQRIESEVKGSLPISEEVRDYIHRSLVGVTTDGTAAGPFIGFPLNEIPIASKTGTGQVTGRDSNSWFASYAPANNPKYAVVMMVSQGGTGSGTSAPSVRKIYEAIFGVVGNQVFPERSIFNTGEPNQNLPLIGRDGLPIYPELNKPEELNELNYSFTFEEAETEELVPE